MQKLPAIRLLSLGVVALMMVVLLGAYALLACYVYLVPSLPTVDSMRAGGAAVPLRVYARGGELIGEIGEKRRLPVAFQDIPLLVREAFISAEDEHFYEHHGFDYSGVLRAAWVDLSSGDFAQGASTITMQAARNMFLTFDKTIRRKLQEIFLTYRMEHEFTKEQILSTYLNVIFLGQRSYGVAAAAQTYYGKPLSQLTVAEAATLAGIPQAPSRYNPIYNPRAVRARRHYVLGQMRKLGYIDAETERLADQQPVQTRDHGGFSDVEAPYVAEMARAALVSRFGEDSVNEGYKVFTSIDGRLQAAANRAVRLGLIEYARRHGYTGPVGHLKLSAGESMAKLDLALARVPQVGDLRPAVVTSVAARAARVYVQYQGYARIDWDGLSWARRRLSDSAVGPAPKRADDVIEPGDLVYVVTGDQGVAQLAELPSIQGALVAMDPDDGAIVALVGGFDYYANKFNRVTQAHRQPGSGFKPFLYSCALDHGFTPATPVLDAPIVYDAGEQIWRPKNDEGSFNGTMRLREGLVYSRNLMTIRVVRDLGVDTATQCAAQFGFNPAEMPKDLTIALGSLSVTPLQLATAYAVFANGGYRVDNYFIDRIENASGQVVYQASPKVVCDRCNVPLSPPPAPPGAPAGAPGAPGAPGTPNAAGTGDAPAAAETLPGTGVGTAAYGAAAAAAAVAHAVNGGPLPAAPAVVPTAATTPANGAATVLPNAGVGSTPPASSDSSGATAGAAPSVPTDPNRRPTQLETSLLPATRIAPRVISPQNCWLMDDMMADVIKRGTGVRAGLALHRDDISGKTGTTNLARDTWFNGFSPHILASVWVGYDDTRPLGAGEEGARTAVPIWTSFMREALRDQPIQPRPLPTGLVTVRIDKRTGLLAGTNDLDTMYETFMDGHLPAAASPGLVAPGAAPSTPAGGSSAPLF